MLSVILFDMFRQLLVL